MGIRLFCLAVFALWHSSALAHEDEVTGPISWLSHMLVVHTDQLVPIMFFGGLAAYVLYYFLLEPEFIKERRRRNRKHRNDGGGCGDGGGSGCSGCGGCS